MIHVIVKTIVDWGSVAQMPAIDLLHSFTQDMGRTVPENRLSFGIIEFDELQSTIAFQRAIQIPELVVDLGDNGGVCQSLTDSFGDVIWTALP